MSTAATETFKIIRNGFFKGVGLAAGFVTTSLFAAAAAINVFSPGDVISATKINRNFAIAAPEGAIMAFNLTSCPEGWAPADGTNGTPDLRGQFIRGRDDRAAASGGMDPDGARAVGDVQEDAFQGHWHAQYYDAAQTLTLGTYPVLRSHNHPTSPAPTSKLDNTGIKEAVDDGANGAPRTAKETRPKNVALTYCMRKN